MSRAFVKEADGAEPPLARSWGGALPPGTPNLATPWSVEIELGDGSKRELSSGTLVKGASLIAGTPFDLEIPTPRGNLETLHLVTLLR